MSVKQSSYKHAGRPVAQVLRHPARFALQVIKGFRANQGFLLSGAVAYYTLLSIVPLFTFLLLVLSRLVDESVLLSTLTRYLALVIPGETALVAQQANDLLAHRQVATWLLVAILL